MAVSIPVEKAELLKRLNLPSDLDNADIFDNYSLLVLAYLKKVTNEEEYTASTSGSDDKPERVTAFQTAYCFLAFKTVLPFINLKTNGNGIIKSTGIDSNKSTLLSGDEINKEQKRLEKSALEILEDYLNDSGKQKLGIFSPNKRQFRIRVI